MTGLTLVEPARKSSGEEQVGADGKKISIWSVISQPRIIVLCLAASIRHCGKNIYFNYSLNHTHYTFRIILISKITN